MKHISIHIGKSKSILLNIVILLALIFATSLQIVAQNHYSEQLAIENLSIQKTNNLTNISMDIDLGNLDINTNEMIIITPVLVSNKQGNSTELEPFAVVGKRRNKVLNRPFTWKGKTDIEIPQSNKMLRKRGSDQSLQYVSDIPYAEWQRDARLILTTEVVGCADCSENEPDIILSNRVLREIFIPDYQYAFIEPDVEELKQRSETYSAHLNYIVARTDLLPDFENNREELNKIDKQINELKSNEDLSITDFTITGYASPEAPKEKNLYLSQRRAENFAKYIEKNYGYTSDQFSVKWVGEDWAGLRTAVAASNLANKNQIIEIIDNVPEYDARDRHLIALDNGVTYRKLLNEFYPPLRRNDYRIAFTTRPFKVEEAAEIIKSHPKHLSLNEMFLVANTYPVNSKEYNEVFEIAANTFPENVTANVNVAIKDLRDNKIDGAIARLEKFKDSPEAWNTLAVAYAKKEMFDKAQEYLTKAVESGNTEAKHNLQQVKSLLEDR